VVGALLVAATGHVPKKGRLALMLQLAFATLLGGLCAVALLPGQAF